MKHINEIKRKARGDISKRSILMSIYNLFGILCIVGLMMTTDGNKSGALAIVGIIFYVIVRVLMISKLKITKWTMNLNDIMNASWTYWMTIITKLVVIMIASTIIVWPGYLFSENKNWEMPLVLCVIFIMIISYIVNVLLLFSVANTIYKAYPTGQAMKESFKVMKSNIWSYTKLRLTFILWDISNIITVGLISIYYEPYKQATILEYRKDILK